MSRVSVVVCTYNRAAGLVATLDSLRLQRFPEFEVVVVNGPSTDHTARILRDYDGPLRVVDNPLPNLSVSRNAGIRASAGDVIAFLDDDALPEPSWLEQTVAAFDAPDVAGVGGLVFDPTGVTLQFAYAAVSRLADPTWGHTSPLDRYCFPGTDLVPYLQGTNMAFRKDALYAIGLFDEEFAYGYDDVDICCRLIDGGYRLRQLPCAPVHHKTLASGTRNEKRVVTRWRSIVDARVYFSHRHSLAGPDELRARAEQYVAWVLTDAEVNERAGNVEAGHADRARRDCEEGIIAGERRGRERAGLRLVARESEAPGFLPFLPADRLTSRNVAVLGGPERMADAEHCAERGDSVRLLTIHDGPSEVDLVGDVWVHRLAAPPLPGERWRDETFQAELRRIAGWWSPDVIDRGDGAPAAEAPATVSAEAVVSAEEAVSQVE